MFRSCILLFLAVCAWGDEPRALTLRQAVELALQQSPDLALARLDEQIAEQTLRELKGYFIPKVVVGSGLAYSSGFPMSIEGATPSVFQARAVADVFNRQDSYRVAAARELRKTASLSSAAKRDEVVFRTADLYLEAERDARAAETSRRQVEALQAVASTVGARVEEGRELPLESKRAALNLAKARLRVQALDGARRSAEAMLAAALGCDPAAGIRVTVEDRTPPALPASEEEAAKLALDNSKELRVLESKMLAKNLDVRAERAGRLPRFDLVAQYGLLARFNNYEDFFQRFQRHNGQLGVSLQIPVWTGPGVAAAASRAEAEGAQLRVQIRTARARIAAGARQQFQEIKQAEAGIDVARLDLEVAREQLSVMLAQMQEGRAGLRQVEEARLAETEKWLAFYDANAGLERARLNLLRQTGMLASAWR